MREKKGGMLVIRLAAVMLALVLTLTYIPVLAFAESNDTDADIQKPSEELTEEAAEAAAPADEQEEEASEEGNTLEAEETLTEGDAAEDAASDPVPVKITIKPIKELWGYAGNVGCENLYQEGNSITITFSDNTTKTIVSEGFGFYDDSLDERVDIEIKGKNNAKLKEGKNTATIFYKEHDDKGKLAKTTEVGTATVIGMKTKTIVSVKYEQKKVVEAEVKDGWVNYWGDYACENGTVYYNLSEIILGDIITVTFKENENSDKTITYRYKCIPTVDGSAFVRIDKNGQIMEVEEGGDLYWLFEEVSAYPEYRDDQVIDPATGQSNWLPGETHYATVAIQGVEATGGVAVKIKGEAPHKHTIEVKGKKDATCTSKGYTGDKVCSVCGQTVEKGSETPVLSHNIKSVSKAATCQETGLKKHFECTNCHNMFKDASGSKELTDKEIKKLTIKKKKHSFKEKSGQYLKSAATCTKPAVYYYTCKMCHQKGKKTYKAGKKLGHDFVSGNIKKATAKKDGKIAAKCSRCGKTNKGTKIPKAGKIVVLNKKSVAYVGAGGEKALIKVVVKNSKYPLSAKEYNVTYSEPVYNGKKSKGIVTIKFKPECKYYSGSMTLTYKITKAPKK